MESLAAGSDASGQGDGAAEPDEPPLAGLALAERRNRAHSSVRIERHGAGENVVAQRAFEAGDVVFSFDRAIRWPVRDRFTVEDPAGRHVFDPVLASVAHACRPNARLAFDARAAVALRHIAPGEPITLDYLATESDIAAPFVCRCRAADCRGWIGRPQLPPLTRER